MPRIKTRARRPAEHGRPRTANAAPAGAVLRLTTFGNDPNGASQVLGEGSLGDQSLPALGLATFRSDPNGPTQVHPPKPDSWRRRVQRPESNRNNPRLEPDLTPANSTRARFLTATKSSIAFPRSFAFSGAENQSRTYISNSEIGDPTRVVVLSDQREPKDLLCSGFHVRRPTCATSCFAREVHISNSEIPPLEPPGLFTSQKT